jgi:hypothetical protein
VPRQRKDAEGLLLFDPWDVQDKRIMEVFSWLMTSGMRGEMGGEEEDLPTPPSSRATNGAGTQAAKAEEMPVEEDESELTEAEKEARKRKADALEVCRSIRHKGLLGACV